MVDKWVVRWVNYWVGWKEDLKALRKEGDWAVQSGDDLVDDLVVQKAVLMVVQWVGV